MNPIDLVLNDPELLDRPPVLVDVGAAGGVHPAWTRIARYAVGLGFEPDAREADPLVGMPGQFRSWTYFPALVLPTAPAAGRQALHLTRSPQCSSTLRPAAALGEWAFASLFAVEQTKEFAATTLPQVLAERGLDRVDWLKCDTQGLDWGIFQSLPESFRHRMLAVEFEPGLIDAYDGEDKLADVLAGMQGQPFWLAEMSLGRTARGREETLRRRLGPGVMPWIHRLAPTAPAWANVHFLRDLTVAPETLDRRAYLLAWVFATLAGQHASALVTGEAGLSRFGDPIFEQVVEASTRGLRWAMVRRLPAWFWRRITR